MYSQFQLFLAFPGSRIDPIDVNYHRNMTALTIPHYAYAVTRISRSRVFSRQTQIERVGLPPLAPSSTALTSW